MILSVPITSLVKIALESYEDTRGSPSCRDPASEIEWMESTAEKVDSGYKSDR
jgi:hypothetical protein